jgi:hypothetical protein
MGCWVCPRIGLDGIEKINFLSLTNSNFYPSVVKPAASCLVIVLSVGKDLTKHNRFLFKELMVIELK